MGEQPAGQFVTVLDEENMPVEEVFLDLQPDLWNEDQTQITLWLDPGRIKQDLIPNLNLGMPIKEGKSYTIIISNKWKSANGVSLPKDYIKKLVVRSKDLGITSIESWRIIVPAKGTRKQLIVEFNEVLDYILLNECISILDIKGKEIEGVIEVGDKEKAISFYPKYAWLTGEYIIKVLTELEDLAGNNLNRPFDKDLTSSPLETSEMLFKKKPFFILD
jgi:hypothetical protein